MVANAPGSSGGFSASSNPKGPTAGYDPVIGKIDRRLKKNKNYPSEIVKFVNSMTKHKGNIFKASKDGRR